MIKKIILMMVILCLAFVAKSENRLYGGIEAGWNVSYPVDATQAKHGFRIGVFGELQVSRLWSFDASLRLSYKPWKNSHITNGGETWEPDLQYRKVSYSGNPYVLELPVHAAVNLSLSKDMRMNIAVGPYVGVGLFGSGKYNFYQRNTDGAELQESDKTSDIYGDKTGDMKRFEVGVDARLGLEIKRHYLISLGYQFQFNNPARKKTPIGQSQIFNLSVGYKF